MSVKNGHLTFTASTSAPFRVVPAHRGERQEPSPPSEANNHYQSSICEIFNLRNLRNLRFPLPSLVAAFGRVRL